MRFRNGFVVLVLAMLVSSAMGGEIVLDKGGDSSGWKASWSDEYTVDISVDDVSDTSVTISITKTLTEPAAGELAIVKIGFEPADFAIAPVSRIIISGETITNGTGFKWTEYRWILSPSGVATFNSTDSAWDVSPSFDNSTLEWKSPGTISELWADGGSGVSNNGTFSPGGSLIIDVDTSGLPIFDFKQVAVPEPSVIALILAGFVGIAVRRRRVR